MNYSHEEKCWLWLTTLEGLSADSARQLVEHYGSVTEVRRQAQENTEAFSEALGPEVKRSLTRTLTPNYLDRLAAALEHRGIQAISCEHPLYSRLLREIPDPPLLLYAIGDLTLLNSPYLVTMVGSRAATNYGRKCAYSLAGELAAQGVTVVSGMARGVDSYAHKGALDAGGKTIAVLGCGVNVVYPKENEELYDEIREKGLIISEYLPGAPPLKQHFPERNRIVSGLSHATVILESGKESGARITANLALDQGREVLAVPGNIGLPLSYTPNQLIREGCAMVTCAEDVLEVFGIAVQPEGEETPAAEPAPAPRERTGARSAPVLPEEEEPPRVSFNGKLTEDEQTIKSMLEMGPASYDEIYEALELSPAKLGANLAIMTAKGILRELPGKVYEIHE